MTRRCSSSPGGSSTACTSSRSAPCSWAASRPDPESFDHAAVGASVSAQVRGDLLDRGLLVGPDGDPVLLVHVGDPVHDAEDEAPVVVDLLGRRLAAEERDGVAELLQGLLLQLPGGVGTLVLDLGLLRDELVEQLALAVLPARLCVRLCQRE